MKITDGLGRGYDVGVSPDNHLLVQSFSVQALDHATFLGDAYVLTTQVINLSGSSEIGMLYMQNTDPVRSVKLDRLRVSFGAASGTTITDVIGKTYSSAGGALSGTLITSGSGAPSNLNITLRQTPNGVFRAATGSLLTIGGPGFAGRVFQTMHAYDEQISNVVGPGGAIAISIIPPTGTLSMPTSVTVYFYMADPEFF